MRSRISIRGCVRRSVGPSVGPSFGPSVGPSVGPSHTSWNRAKWAKFEQNSIRNKKVSHLKDDSKTSTWAVCQRTHLLSELCSTCFVSLSEAFWCFTHWFVNFYTTAVFFVQDSQSKGPILNSPVDEGIEIDGVAFKKRNKVNWAKNNAFEDEDQ